MKLGMNAFFCYGVNYRDKKRLNVKNVIQSYLHRNLALITPKK